MFQAASGLIDTAVALIFLNPGIGVIGEELREDDPVREATADREGIADDCPLRLTQEAENLAEIVDQACQNEPACVSVGPDRFGGLHEVLDLAQLRIRVAFIDQRVEEFHRLPDSHDPMVSSQILALFLLDEVKSLKAMVEAIELAHRRANSRSIIAE